MGRLCDALLLISKALEWVDLGAAVLERGPSDGPVPLWPPPASQSASQPLGARPKASGRKIWLETPRHESGSHREVPS